MKKRRKIGANEQCPCWSGKKYKKCCRGTVDWPAILAAGDSHIPYMSARGRNILFAEAIFDALQLDNEQSPNLAKFKKAFTPTAVRRIHEAIFELWPPNTDLRSVLRKSASSVAGLFIGDYESVYLERSVVRHCLYSDRILLVDPFLHPYGVSPEFNPLENPAQHRLQTLKNVNRFLRFLPWIDAGLIEFIRTPDDLDMKLKRAALEQAHKAVNDPTIKNALQETVDDLSARHRDQQTFQDLVLGAPDSQLRRIFREELADTAPVSEDDFIAYIQQQRDKDPDFLEPIDKSKSQLRFFTSGGTVEIAKATAEMADAYLFTDLKVRWEVLKKDREALAIESKEWSPFAKAVQEADLSFLDNVDLSVALDLRTEGRLEGVRGVLRKAWQANLSSDSYDEANTKRFASNLVEAIEDATAEWEAIKADLVKFGSAELAGGLLAAGPLIAQGHAVWVAGAALAAATGHSLTTRAKKRGFEKRYPASFFIDLATDN